MLTDSRGNPKPGAPTVHLACSLYRELSRESGTENLMFSPYSIATALAMLLAGSEGSTGEEIARVLGHEQEPDALLGALQKIQKQLDSRRGVEILTANGLWCQSGYPLEQNFVEDLVRVLAMQVDKVDFASAPSDAADKINAWVSESTRGKIDEILSAANLPPLTRVVLANAIYFKGAWEFPFLKSSTRPEPFHLSDGSSIDVPTMHQKVHFPYVERRGLQYLALPYGVDYTRLLILLPKRNGMAVDDAIQLERVGDAGLALKSREIVLSMPRFSFRSFFGLVPVLRRLGVASAFGPEADFRRISSEPGFAVSELLHKTYVDVTESGTEAAAVTSTVVIGAGGNWRPPPPLVIRVDRPFAFLIYDSATGAVLFAGRVTDPRRG